MTKHNEEFSHLLFSERESIIPLPTPLKLGELSADLRRALWDHYWSVYRKKGGNILSIDFNDSFYLCKEINIKSFPILSEFLKQPMNIIEQMCLEQKNNGGPAYFCEQIFLQKEEEGKFYYPYNRVFDFLELSLNNSDLFSVDTIKSIFKKHQVAYTLISFESNKCWNFHPITSEANRVAVQTALQSIEKTKYQTAVQHLATASNTFKTGNFKQVVLESNAAVEAIAREITGKSTLGKALMHMRNGSISNNLLDAFDKFSAFASSTVRHGKEVKKGDLEIGQGEALLMFGACAAIASYLATTDKVKPKNKVKPKDKKA